MSCFRDIIDNIRKILGIKLADVGEDFLNGEADPVVFVSDNETAGIAPRGKPPWDITDKNRAGSGNTLRGSRKNKDLAVLNLFAEQIYLFGIGYGIAELFVYGQHTALLIAFSPALRAPYF